MQYDMMEFTGSALFSLIYAIKWGVFNLNICILWYAALEISKKVVLDCFIPALQAFSTETLS